MRNLLLHWLPLLLAVSLAGCSPTIAATEPALADSFFSAQALLDANGNGQIDSADTPLENATFIVTLQGGGEFGDQTGADGKAFVTIPANVEYPVTVRMEAPENSGLKAIEPSTITLSEPANGTATFLFSK